MYGAPKCPSVTCSSRCPAKRGWWSLVVLPLRGQSRPAMRQLVHESALKHVLARSALTLSSCLVNGDATALRRARRLARRDLPPRRQQGRVARALRTQALRPQLPRARSGIRPAGLGTRPGDALLRPAPRASGPGRPHALRRQRRPGSRRSRPGVAGGDGPQRGERREGRPDPHALHRRSADGSQPTGITPSSEQHEGADRVRHRLHPAQLRLDEPGSARPAD